MRPGSVWTRIGVTLIGLFVVLRAEAAYAVPEATVMAPTSFDFGMVSIGDPAPNHGFTITNSGIGGAALSVTNITESGPGCGDFMAVPTSFSLISGDFTVVTVVFTPSSRGAKVCTFTLVDNDSNSDTFVATGTGIAPNMATSGVTACGTAAVNGGTTTTCTVTITNMPPADDVLDYFVNASNSAEFSPSALSGTLAVGGMVTLTFTFNPSAAGSRTSTATISGNDPSNSQDTFPQTGTGTVPTISSLVPGTTANLGNTDVGATSAPVTISLMNSGLATLNVSAVAFTGGNASQFAIATGTTTSHTVAASGSDSWTVTCTPTSMGAKTTTFRITSDAPSGSPGTNQDITLNCTGLQAVFTFSPPGGLNFGAIEELTTSTLPLTINNTGNKAGEISTLVPDDAVYTYVVTGGDVPRTVAAGGSLTVNVTFAPINGNTSNKTLAVTAMGSPASFSVPLFGDGVHTGVDLEVTGEPDLAVDLGDVRVATLASRTVTISNTSDVPITVTAPASDDAHCAIVRITPMTYPTTMTPGATATFRIDTTPDAVGAEMCQISVSSNIPSVETIDVLVNGVAPDVALSSSLLDYGGVDLDNGPRTRVLAVSNPGTLVLSLSNCAVTGNGFTLDAACPATVAVGESADVSITFTPDASASFTGTFTANVDALTVSAISVPLMGSGGQGRVMADLALDFPDTVVDETRLRQVNVQNVGDADLTITAADITAATPFTVVTALPVVIEGGDDVDIEIEFGPDELGFTEADLTLTTDDETRPSVVVSLTGTGVEGALPDAGPGVGDPRTYYTCQTGGGTGLITGLLLALGVGAMRRRRRA